MNIFVSTALVSFDVLKTIYLLKDIISENDKIEFIEVVKPLINLLTLNNEEHGIISNSNRSRSNFMLNHLTGEKNDKKETILNIIFKKMI